MATKQLLGGDIGGYPNTSATGYAPFLYGRSGPFSTSYSYTSDIIPTGGTLSKLTIALAGSPGDGKSYAFTVMKNDVATDLTITISGATTQGQDLEHSVACSAGDYISLRSVPSGTPAGSLLVSTVIVWEPTIDGEYIFGGNSTNSLVGNNYISLAAPTFSSTEAQHTALIPLAGTVKKLAYQHQVAPGAGKSVICTARKNGADQSLVATVTGASATQNIDTTNSFSVTAGDLICAVLSVSGGATSYRASWAVVLLPSDTSKVPTLGSFSSTLSTSATQYGYICFSQNIQTSGTVSDNLWYSGFNFSEMHVALTAAPGDGKSRTITLRDDNADTDLAVTISGANTTGSVSATHEPADLSWLNFKSVPTNTPAAAYLKLGFVYSTSAAAPPYDDGTPEGGIVFGGSVVEIGTLDAIDGVASGGIVMGGAVSEDEPDELHQVDGAASGGIVFGGAVAERWTAVPNNGVAVKGGTYRISGTLYTLTETMSYPGLGSIAAIVNCGDPPAVAGQYRYDLLSINAAGTITVTAGTASTTPVMPTLPANEVRLDHVLRYYGQTTIIQADIGKIWTAPVLTTLTASVDDDELSWAETDTDIDIVCRDQYGQLYTGGKIINASITTGNGTLTPASRSGSASTLTFNYTRDGEVTDVSPVLTFTASTGPFVTVFIRLLDSDGDLMV